MITIQICPCCKPKIEKYGEMVLTYLENLLNEYANAAICEISLDDDIETNRTLQLISFLEKRKYLVTTEGGYFKLLIKPNGFYKIEKCVNYFCFSHTQFEKDGLKT